LTVGVLRLDLIVRGSRSLKDRRRHVKGLKDRLISRFKVACAEVGRLDSPQHAELGIATVSNDGRHAAEILNKIVGAVRLHRELEVVDYDIELL
jgi:uncharacterized protein YlxP (DUF503 family)